MKKKSTTTTILYSASFPARCWVDDATVSSVAASVAPDDAAATPTSPRPTETPPPGGHAPAADAPAASIVNGDATNKRDPGRRESVTVTLAVPGQRQGQQGAKFNNKNKTVLPEVTPTKSIEEQSEPKLEIEPEPEVEKEPALPGTLCPSSGAKASQAEVKLWLRRSPFSAARRSVPVFWT